VKILQLYLAKALVAQDAGIGDQRIDAATFVHGLLDQVRHAGIVADRGTIGDGLAAAVQRAAQIVDHDFRAQFGQRQGVRPAQSPAGAG